MTKHLKPALILSIGLLVLGASTGCISTSETIYTDTDRVKISFATEKAGRIFYEALARTSETRPRTERRTEVNLILIDVDRRVVSGPNRLFNDAVGVCDSDKDGVVSEIEAEVFASAWQRRSRKDD